MLAHDYGMKRVMSSYAFTDTDAGPPPNPPGCGAEWICEHRWSAIGKTRCFYSAKESFLEWKIKAKSVFSLIKFSFGD